MNTEIETARKTEPEAQSDQRDLMNSLWVLAIVTLTTVILFIPFVS